MVIPASVLAAVIFKKVKQKRGHYEYLEDMYPKLESAGKKASFRFPRWVLIPTWIGTMIYVSSQTQMYSNKYIIFSPGPKSVTPNHVIIYYQFCGQG